MPANWRDARVSLIEDVRSILTRFREEHHWQPGQVWNPQLGNYVEAKEPETK